MIYIRASYTNTRKKWFFKRPDFGWFSNTKGKNKTRGKLAIIPCKYKREKFTFFSSYYINDEDFTLLSKVDLKNAMILFNKHSKRFGLTIHAGSAKKRINQKRNSSISLEPEESPFHPIPTTSFSTTTTSSLQPKNHLYLDSTYTLTIKNSPGILNYMNKAQ